MINQQLNNPPNIIGISGKINCGKDLVGKIIQYLTTTNEYVLKNKPTFEDWMNNYSHHSNWEIKKFADKLKDIVCLLIGCTRQQLEDRNFKEKDLGEEWNKIVHPIINGFSKEDIDLVEKLTPRKILQLLGTECGRHIVHPNIWVNALFADIDKELNANPNYNKKGFIITDVRFPNEADAVKDREGIIIRIERNDYIFDENGKRIIPTKEYINTNNKQHESETALDNYKFDYVINNNGTINNLVDKVKEILIKENKLL